MIQKSVRKRIICILLIVCCTATCFNASMVKAQAAKDITNSATHNIRALCELFPSACGYDLVYKMKVGQKKKYNFSKASTRRYALNRCYSELYSQYSTGASINTLSNRIFGKKTSKVNMIIADWGLTWPTIKVKKIYKLSSGKYKVKANVNWNDDGDYVGKPIVHKIGNLQITLKKKPKSYYGYIVKSMALKKVSD